MAEPLRTAQDAFRRGAFARAAEALQSGANSAEALVLGAKIASRLEGARVALDRLSPERDAMRGAQRQLATALLASFAAMAGDLERADHETDALTEPYPEKVADEIVYDLAFVRATQGRGREARSLLESRAPGAPAMRAQYLLLQGWIDGTVERFASQAALARRALKLLLKEAPGEGWLMATAAHTLAGLVREMREAGDVAALVEAEERIPWTEDLDFEHFQTLRCIGWRYALDANYVRALFYLSRSLSHAVKPWQNALAHLDHAFVAHWAGEMQSFEAELALAEHSYSQIKWDAAHAEEVTVAVVAADAFADRDPKRARQYLSEARKRRSSLQAHFGLAQGARFDALLAAAEARVERHGNRGLAERAARDAYEAFSRMRYDWRAARVALDLQELTGDDAWLARARERLEGYGPNSLTAEVDRRERMPEISPRLREILRMLHEGLKPDEIAGKLGTSVHTVNNQIGKLLKKFNTTHRVGLLAVTREIA